jgi:transcriptional regulator GlxA family with amidase domain
MQIAFILFQDITALDLVGIYDPITRLKSMGLLAALSWDICAREEYVRDDRGILLAPTKVAKDLSQFDVLVVPGGFGTRALRRDSEFICWLQTASSASLKVSVCTGALLLGAAGFLKGRTATTHPNAFEELREYCEQVVDRRIVDAGDVITGGGVSSAIDVGLYVVEKLAGGEARRKISKQMDYPYAPKLEWILKTS